MRVFISYRRDDAAGHAGRLADDLGDRIGHENVFQDVESIQPGEDFIGAIERAVTTADVVLVVIGPDWATVATPGGGPRIAEPDDVVALEVATALRSTKRVVPVLVGGAQMPVASGLPPAIAPLARRNAVEVRPGAWDEDLHRLVVALEPHEVKPPVGGRVAAPLSPPTLPAVATNAPGAASTSPWPLAVSPSRSRRPLAVGAVGVALAGVIGVAIVARSSGDAGRAPRGATTAQSSAASTALTSSAASSAASSALTSSAAASSSTAGSKSVTTIELPEIARTSLAAPSRDPFDVDVRSATIGRDGADQIVRLALRLHNGSRYNDFVGAADIQLVADGTRIDARDGLGVIMPGDSDLDVNASYVVAGAPAELTVRVRRGDLVAQIPLRGPAAQVAVAALVLVPDSALVATADARITVGPASVDALADRLTIKVPVTFENLGAYDSNFWDRDFRLVIDGVKTPPVGVLNEAVAGRSSKQATLRWDVPLGTRTLTLSVSRASHETEVPVTAS